MKTKNEELKQMVKCVHNSYRNGYLRNDATKKILYNKVDIRASVRKDLYELFRKNDCIMYGTVVSASTIPQIERTSDFDVYCKKERLPFLLTALRNKYGNRVSFRQNERYNITKVIIDNNEVADISTDLHKPVKRKDGGYSITNSPIRTTASKYPVRKYPDDMRSQTIEVQHNRTISATALNKPKREHKDSYRLSILNRYSIYSLLRDWKKGCKTATLRKLILDYLRAVCDYSTRKDVMQHRVEVEKALIKLGYCNYRLFTDKNSVNALKLVKQKVDNGTLNIDKDFKLIKDMCLPTKITDKPVKQAEPVKAVEVPAVKPARKSVKRVPIAKKSTSKSTEKPVKSNVYVPSSIINIGGFMKPQTLTNVLVSPKPKSKVDSKAKNTKPTKTVKHVKKQKVSWRKQQKENRLNMDSLFF